MIADRSLFLRVVLLLFATNGLSEVGSVSSSSLVVSSNVTSTPMTNSSIYPNTNVVTTVTSSTATSVGNSYVSMTESSTSSASVNYSTSSGVVSAVTTSQTISVVSLESSVVQTQSTASSAQSSSQPASTALPSYATVSNIAGQHSSSVSGGLSVTVPLATTSNTVKVGESTVHLSSTSSVGVVQPSPTYSVAVQPPPTDSGVAQSSPTDSGVAQSSPTDSGVVQPSPTYSVAVQPPPTDSGVAQSSPTDSGVVQSSPTDSGIVQSFPTDSVVVQSSPTNSVVVNPSSDHVSSGVQQSNGTVQASQTANVAPSATVTGSVGAQSASVMVNGSSSSVVSIVVASAEPQANTTAKPEVASSAPVKPSSAAPIGPTRECFHCEYNTTMEKDQQVCNQVEKACNSDETYCIDYHVVYTKDDVVKHAKGCGDKEMCKNTTDSCEKYKIKDKMKSCSLVCCVTDKCNDLNSGLPLQAVRSSMVFLFAFIVSFKLLA